MKKWIGWSVWLYPPEWRARYAEEFLALVEDSPPSPGDLWDAIRGAMLMQMTSGSVPKLVAGFALAGLLAAGVLAWRLPDRYVSVSVLKVNGEESRMDRQHRWQKAFQTALSRNSLARIMVEEGLYPEARRQKPMEDVIQDMRNKDIRIAPHGRNEVVEFAYPDPIVAQKTTRDLVAALRNADPDLDVLDPASAPSAPSSPNRAQMLGAGLLAGLVVGMLCGGVWAIARGRHAWSMKRVAAFAAGGMVLGGAVASQIPNQFISSAVLRTMDDSKLQPAMARVTDGKALNALAQKFRLYEREQDAPARMRNDLRIQRVTQVNGASIATAFTVSYRYPDRFKAQAVTRELAAGLMQEPDAQMEMLDPASDPQAPSSPNRLQIILMGTVAGALLGLASTRFRRPAPAVAMLLAVVAISHAQTPRPQFEVASVKRNTECGNRRGGGVPPAPGRLNLGCQTPMGLIQAAYVGFANGVSINLKIPEITGAPAWAQSDTYDVTAKAEDHAPVAQMWGPMLQALLEDRFKLKIHRDTKEVSVFLLTVAKGGVKLAQTKDGSCVVIDPDHLPAPPKPGEPRPNFCGNMSMPRNGSVTTLTGHGLTMEFLAGGPLSRWVGRPILDKTGLSGMYDIQIEFAPDEATDGAAPSIFAALLKVGLKLEAGKGPVETLVIDHLERPTEN
jgi:uncharacterized protein (TIGR03435 family)